MTRLLGVVVVRFDVPFQAEKILKVLEVSASIAAFTIPAIWEAVSRPV